MSSSPDSWPLLSGRRSVTVPAEHIESPIASKIKFQFTNQWISNNSLLITFTPQLASDWKLRILKRDKQKVSETPRVLFWQEWLNQLAATLPTSPIPLTKLQEQQLWDRVISDDLHALAIKASSIRALTRGASQAWELMQAYQIPISKLALGGEEGEALARWITEVQSELKSLQSEQRMLSSEVESLISDTLSEPQLQKLLPDQILLDGFELLSPMQLEILEKVELAGCNVSCFKALPTISTQTLTAAPDESSEQAHVVARIKHLLDQDPQMRIGIATSESCDCNALQHLLDCVLTPESLINPAFEFQAVNMAGKRLSETPMLQQLLHLLSIAGNKSIAFADFSPLLFSPWIRGYEEEKTGRADLDAMFRRQNRHQLSLNSLKESADLEQLPHLKNLIITITEWSRESRTAAAWIKSLQKLLQTSGFIQAGLASESLRSNIEIQQMNMFRDLLLSLVAINQEKITIPWREFLSLLRSTCSEKLFSLTPKFPNVMVMPLSRIAGLHFEHLFVIGMDEGAFPPPAKPHPLLPLRLQQQYKIPMSSGPLCFESSSWLWQQTLMAAPIIEITYAEQKNEQEQLPSSFANNLTRSEYVAVPVVHHEQLLESFDDNLNTPIQPDETVRGGTSIIKLQSACPFRAFATHRLGITELGTTIPGVEASTKGSLIHLALEMIWNRLKSQQALIALNEEERSQLVDSAIETALQESRSSPAFNLRKFEKKRMQRLLHAWLKLELLRPPFELIGSEDSYELHLPENAPRQFPISIKADRIDRDGEGHRILIDYKTGAKQSHGKWIGERMEEPQLPLYAMAAEITDNDAVAFATLRSGDQMGFEGLSGDDTGIHGIALCDGKQRRPESWQQLLNEWREHINALASEFANGESQVTPRDSKSCAYCGLEAVCRVEESGIDLGMETLE